MPTPITDIDADIIFIIDSSSDVTPENYVREKSLVKDMARYLNVSTGGSRAALITYGNKPTLVFKFGDYGSLPSLDNAVDNIQPSRLSWTHAFRAGHFLRLDRNLKPRVKSLWSRVGQDQDEVKVNQNVKKSEGNIQPSRLVNNACFNFVSHF